MAKQLSAPPSSPLRPVPEAPRRAARGILAAVVAGSSLWVLIGLIVRLLLG